MDLLRIKCLSAIACLSVASVFAVAQAPATQKTNSWTFDSASIRQNTSGNGDCPPDQTQATPSGIHMTNCNLMVLLVAAYAPATGEPLGFAMNDRLVNMPDWGRPERFDITARISEQDLAAWQDLVKRKEMLHVMMQNLLAERFKLVAHRATKEQPVFALVLGKNPPKLKPALTVDSDAIHAKYPRAMGIPGSGGVLVEGRVPGAMDLYGATTGTLALLLSSMAGRPVIDKTGLTGSYDIPLEPLQNRGDGGGGAFDRAAAVFSAVQEQLGLKLEPQKEQVETLVIDHVEKPSEN